MSTPHVPSRSFSPSLSMESPEAVSSGFPPLPTKPPDPDLDVMLLVNPHVSPVSPDPPPVLLVCAFLHHISSPFTTPHHRRDPEALMPWFLCASTSFSLKLLCSHAGMLSVQPLLMNPLLAEAALSSSLTTSQSPLRDLPYHQQEVVEILVASCYYFSATSWSAVFYCYIMLLLNGSLPRSEDVTNPLNFRFKFPLPQYEDAILYRTRLVYLAMVVHLTTINLLEEDGMPQEAPHSTSSFPSLPCAHGYFVRNIVPLVTPLSCSFNLCTIFVFSCCCLCNGCP
ncbi:hypothetical protein HID58_088775 [Brassica napus]|uniref:Uncharacterized protein n=1 Tax=Brassica napus TaxID=3708 RepID=A0ABQ7XX53_BRANA|nr:hypothetical protein HID58_088775 [Brassica napus]